MPLSPTRWFLATTGQLMSRQLLYPLFSALFLMCICGCSGNAKWEYKHFRDQSEHAMTERLNKLGDEGWELVGFSVDRQPNNTEHHTVFKKRK
jgi:hypothetical protein